MIEPRIEHLIEKVDNQYTLVVLAARRARQIVDYYAKLGGGLGERPIPPLLQSAHGLKPLSVALREVEESKIGFERPAGAEDALK
jgi:DNA-directed RNA polymerase subunit omega